MFYRSDVSLISASLPLWSTVRTSLSLNSLWPVKSSRDQTKSYFEDNFNFLSTGSWRRKWREVIYVRGKLLADYEDLFSATTKQCKGHCMMHPLSPSVSFYICQKGHWPMEFVRSLSEWWNLFVSRIWTVIWTMCGFYKKLLINGSNIFSIVLKTFCVFLHLRVIIIDYG